MLINKLPICFYKKKADFVSLFLLESSDMSLLCKLLLLCAVCISVYYPAIFADTCLLDDREMLRNLSSVQRFDLIGTFFPQSHGGLYYRPMIAVSFMIDRFLWNLNPSIMHFENILFHLISTLLVFIIARLIISKISRLPLIAALIFAVHPIATESVNWISGRTDLIAVMFVLTSLYSILCFRHSRQIWWLTASVATLICGILTKETAIGFIPVLVFILSSKSDVDLDITDKPYKQRQFVIAFLVVCILSLAAALFLFNYYLTIVIIILYFFYLQWINREQINRASFQKYLLFFSGSIMSLWALFWGIRKFVFSSQSQSIQLTFGRLFTDVNYTLSLFFRAAGFYTKKFIYPFPLNFVIREVSPFYTLFGIILLCLVVVLIMRRKLTDSLLIAGFCMVAPVLPLTFESIAWTSYAERYVYPAVPFWILSFAGYAASAGFDRLPLRVHRWYLVGLSFLIITMAAFTLQRNLVWQTNLTLFKDSVEKTPGFKQLRGLYMTALFEKGMYDDALRQHQIAQSLQTIHLKYNPNYELFYVQILMAKKEFVKAAQELDRINVKTKGMEPGVYEIFVELAPRIILTSVDESEKMRISEKLADSYDRWYELTKDPMILYRKGQFLLSQDKRGEAGKLFAKAAAAFPDKNLYRGYSEKLARRLTDGL